MSATTRLLTGLAVAAAVAVPALPAQAALPLPPGVTDLGVGRPCPPRLLCIYRDYDWQGPAYGIEPGRHVDLNLLPMAGSGGPTAANNVSSWVNRSFRVAHLLDHDGPRIQPLFPGQDLEELDENNDTVDFVLWP
ncbi:peptidase inhibitor family I36 protein [Nonomuraea sp. NPDC049421]|uniref:peptidase inhibitor family I36 protein n=1 Tax=Nonomuraea sp. NPDC049421 TaxID=3155275 RepID=UPI00343FFA2B